MKIISGSGIYTTVCHDDYLLLFGKEQQQSFKISYEHFFLM